MDGYATVILPAGRNRIAESREGLRLYALIADHRCKPAANLEVTIGHHRKTCRNCRRLGNEKIVELEINPLLLIKTRAVPMDAVLTLFLARHDHE